MNQLDTLNKPIEWINPSNFDAENKVRDVTNYHDASLNILSTDKPLVSVIIRSMDRPTLTDALESIYLQTHSNIEVVLVNAKGRGHKKITTSNARIPLQFVDSELPLLRSRAANMGLVAARGSHLIFLDDDDWFMPEHISVLVEALIKAPGKKVAYSSVVCTDEDKSPLDKMFDHPFDRTRLLLGNYIPIHAALFCRTLVDSGCKMDESLDLYEDWDFWLQAASAGDFVFVNKVTAAYRLGGGSGQALQADPKLVQAVITGLLLKWVKVWRSEDFWNIMLRVVWYDEQLKKISELTDQPKDLKRQLTALQFQHGNLEHQHRDLQHQYRDLQHQHSVLQNQHSELQNQCSKLQHQNINLELQRTEFVRLNENLRLQRDALEDNLVGMQMQIVAIRKQLDSIMSSNSWKLTAPFRKLRLVLSRVFS